jgi:predicted transcriptional regulator
MFNAKAAVEKLLQKLPENASFDDIQYHIYVRQKLERGLADVDEGRVVKDAEVERRLSRWLIG